MVKAQVFLVLKKNIKVRITAANTIHSDFIMSPQQNWIIIISAAEFNTQLQKKTYCVKIFKLTVHEK